jgi:heterodisulfide reductase subunit A
MNHSKIRTGVYICHCGTNIASVVNVQQLTDYASTLPDVILVRDYSYMCSQPGQNLIKEDIALHKLNRVVVASCTPLMHEATFRRACAEGGLNPFNFQMANIREQCSWVISDGAQATRKAKTLVTAAVSRVHFHNPLDYKQVQMIPAALVVGGGIAGIEAALKLAGADKDVYLVERESSIGGHMAQLYKTFPTMDCAA